MCLLEAVSDFTWSITTKFIEWAKRLYQELLIKWWYWEEIFRYCLKFSFYDTSEVALSRSYAGEPRLHPLTQIMWVGFPPYLALEPSIMRTDSVFLIFFLCFEGILKSFLHPKTTSISSSIVFGSDLSLSFSSSSSSETSGHR